MLLNATQNTLDLASSYWSLRGKDTYEHPSDYQGEWIYQAIERGNSIHLVLSSSAPMEH